MAHGISKLDPNVSRVLRSQIVAVSLTSAVREVVQNSVDAGATALQIMVDPFQMSFMVKDNGYGMDPQDLDRVGCQHFTSKIRSLHDLQTLNTFGFRGEALFCIANIAQVTLVSKRSDCNSSWIRDIPYESRLFKDPKGDASYHFSLQPISKEESGTTVLVRNILYNVPVRRRILANDPLFKTLHTLREDLFQVLILRPDISLKVSYLDQLGKLKELISSTNITKDMNHFMKLSQSFSNIFGSVTPIDMFTKVSVKFKGCSVTGLISKCPVRPKEFQFIYLNGRKYTNQAFQKVINGIFQTAGFGAGGLSDTLIKTVGKPFNNYPLIILDVRCPQVAEDLMQDPAKDVVSSSHAHLLHPLILRVIKSFLSHQGYMANSSAAVNDLTENNKTIPNTSSPLPSTKFANSVLNSNARMARLKTDKKVDKTSPVTKQIDSGKIKPILDKLKRALPQDKLDIEQIYEKNDCCVPTPYSNGLGHIERLEGMDFKLDRSQLIKAEVIRQVDKKFILLKIPPNENVAHSMLIIVDQHACDERINLENYLKDFLYQVLEGTLMTHPVSDCAIDIDITEGYLFRHYEKEFKKWAISCEIKILNLETCFLMVSSLPDVLTIKVQGDKQFLKNALLQMVHDFKNSEKIPITNMCDRHVFKMSINKFEWWKYLHCLPTMFREIFNSRACRSSIMFGDLLSTPECSLLIKQLAQCHTPFQCAHGRPSVIPLLELSTEGGPSDNFSDYAKNSYLDYDIDT
ncbi:hypothetical protein ZYGR_0S02290 [Zygosaccharomyces rouxii]|uniref:ZYRO0F07634p n=2 Tax=Zygosaccharomyces rouxii TaxID=4956 RepID=C5DXT4_ZYGRC|nr:uncharacterized protein ZYRO0F07634g [Zygosaccharomyces rouxii]KAH9199354.1 hypothetical protein LQ764DRAFT_129402 [Zygosaccharomyces rouxii]GAV50095.1 hypothetical protein ZYGR_0S02290 [Zygosaccharomyces rouxii]CAR28595.1 ZYRO0F07634p [Zygosaccharomyces rouxii]